MAKKLEDFLTGVDNMDELLNIVNTNLKNAGCKLLIDDGDKNIYVPKSRLDSKIGELKAANETIDTLNTKIEGLKDDPEKVELKKQVEGYQTAMKQMKIDSAVQLIASESKARDVKDLVKFLDMDKLVLLENGDVAGLKEQVDSLVKDKPYLFDVVDPQQPPAPQFPGTGDPGRPGGLSIFDSKTFHEGDFGKGLAQQNTPKQGENVIDSNYFFSK